MTTRLPRPPQPWNKNVFWTYSTPPVRGTYAAGNHCARPTAPILGEK
ncbi:hypothetical protein NPIL_487401, partial [Nephila pilipes]